MAQHNNFNALRIIAALQVFYGHVIYWLKLPLYGLALTQWSFCLPGVPIFFVISGFLISKTYIEHQKNTTQFFVNRFLRIYPGLWCCFTVITLVFLFTGATTLKNIFSIDFIDFSLWQYFTASTDIPALFHNLVYPFQYNGFYKTYPMQVTWSITVELGFYLVIPFLYYFYNRPQKRSGIFWLGFVGVFLISYLFFRGYGAALAVNHSKLLGAPLSLWNQFTAPYLWMFLLGATLYLLFDKIKCLLVNRALWWAVIYIAFNYVAYKKFHFNYANYLDQSYLATIQIVLLAVWVISFAYSFGWLAEKLRFLDKWDLSYGIYLYHMPLVFTLVYWGIGGSVWLLLPVLLATLLLALLSWLLVEKKALALKRTWKIKFSREPALS